MGLLRAINQPLTFSAADLLANVTDADGDALSIDGLTASGGTLTANADGTWTLVATGSQPITLSYQVTDGTFTVADSAVVSVAASSTGPLTSLVASNEAQVNTTVDGHQTDPAVAALSNGNCVVVWLNGDGRVYGQLYSADGTKIGSQFLISNTYSTLAEDSLEVVALADGGFAVGWQASATGLSARLYDASGTAQGSEFVIASDAYSAASSLSLTALSGGGFAASWQTGANAVTIETASYDSYGARIGGYTIAAGTTTYQPAIAAQPGGNLVEVWSIGASIKLQIFTASGTAVTTAATVSQAGGSCADASAAAVPTPRRRCRTTAPSSWCGPRPAAPTPPATASTAATTPPTARRWAMPS